MEVSDEHDPCILLTTGEAAAEFGMTPQGIDRWIRLGHLPYGRLPGTAKRLVRRADVLKLVTTDGWRQRRRPQKEEGELP